MRAVNVRQLKNNPSEALRAARTHPVVVLHGDRPEAMIVHLDDDSVLAAPGMRRAIATALFREASLSLGQAASFARTPLAEFIQHLSRLGIPVVRGAAASVEEDARSVSAWRRSSSRPTRAR